MTRCINSFALTVLRALSFGFVIASVGCDLSTHFKTAYTRYAPVHQLTGNISIDELLLKNINQFLTYGLTGIVWNELPSLLRNIDIDKREKLSSKCRNLLSEASVHAGGSLRWAKECK